ncbi:hypothetical protein [Ramlibacter sp. PS4R-6]|uniref:hypothetical protein n=1 Tax=Ramlibacter sp. PS4R-6 TaxID=3133438 RepID=UPI0030A03EFD
MSANHRRDPAAPDPKQDSDTQDDMQRGGAGSASALERMKAEHALRHKRQHGARTWGPGHEDDQAPER